MRVRRAELTRARLRVYVLVVLSCGSCLLRRRHATSSLWQWKLSRYATLSWPYHRTRAGLVLPSKSAAAGAPTGGVCGGRTVRATSRGGSPVLRASGRRAGWGRGAGQERG